ncbi:MAG: HD domain-containing phosphohydrolase [Pseudomonadota bacterium]
MAVKREKILLVDDEQSIIDVAKEYFALKGYDVVTAANGKEAVHLLESESVDCCFTDINMPEMDGLELAEHIRRIDNSLPVIIMTGYPSLDNTIQTLKNGVVDFLIKPVNLNQMELCVRRVLRERKLFAENLLLKNEVEGKARLERLNGELTAKVEELHILNQIMTDFTSISSSAGVLQRITQMATEITHANESRFFIINDAMADPMEMAVTFGKKRPGEGGGNGTSSTRSQLGERDLKKLARVVMETAADEIPLLVSQNNGTVDLPAVMSSFVAVPLKIRKKVFGILVAAVFADVKQFTEKDLFYMTYMAQNAANAIENLALYENIYENLFATLFGFVKAVEARDSYTQKHSNRVTDLALVLGEELGCTTEELDVLNFAGQLHDIGKIGIRDDILLKPDRLTQEEFDKIKEHPVIGADIVGHLGMWEREQQIIRSHHERFDGNGYPDGLSGEDIPFLARILSVCDAYDAMASDRVYRQKMPREKIMGIITSCAGTQFDPAVVDAFVRIDGKKQF